MPVRTVAVCEVSQAAKNNSACVCHGDASSALCTFVRACAMLARPSTAIWLMRNGRVKLGPVGDSCIFLAAALIMCTCVVQMCAGPLNIVAFCRQCYCLVE